MYKLILFLGICSSFASGSKPPEKLPAKHPAKHSARLPVTDNKCQKIVGCYCTSCEEMTEGTVMVDMIDVSPCTHLFYSAAALLGKDASVQMADEYEDLESNGFERINNLRKKNRGLKTLIAMTELSTDDTKNNNNIILFDSILREKLVNNVVSFVQKCKFNGIELQSQYLAENNAVASDKQNFISLLKALKEKFEKNDLILSLAVDAREVTAQNYDIKEISKYVSFINLRTYNFHGDRTYDNRNIVRAGHIAPLYHSAKENTEDRKLNVDYVVKFWLSKGAPSNKLILGTTFSGISYNLANPKQVGRDAPVVEDPKYALPTMTYYDICPKEKNRVWKTFWDEEQQVPYIYKRTEMIVYDNIDSIKVKAEYAKNMKLGGVFVDSIGGDDNGGHCGGGKSPLLKTISRVLRDKC